MRKPAVSLIALSALTACKGQELNTQWSFEVPDGPPPGDEQLSRFDELIHGPSDADIAMMGPFVDEPKPTFNQELPDRPAEVNPASAQVQADDLLSDAAVDLTAPQRGPRPDPMAFVRFSKTDTVVDSRYLERLISLSQTRQSSQEPAENSAAPLDLATAFEPAMAGTEQATSNHALPTPGKNQLDPLPSALVSDPSTGIEQAIHPDGSVTGNALAAEIGQANHLPAIVSEHWTGGGQAAQRPVKGNPGAADLLAADMGQANQLPAIVSERWTEGGQAAQPPVAGNAVATDLLAADIGQPTQPPTIVASQPLAHSPVEASGQHLHGSRAVVAAHQSRAVPAALPAAEP
jgi:hypothetical protein